MRWLRLMAFASMTGMGCVSLEPSSEPDMTYCPTESDDVCGVHAHWLRCCCCVVDDDQWPDFALPPDMEMGAASPD